jgi:pSer/pThr/pTyr-binding forkhead associated (FHA) protein
LRIGRAPGNDITVPFPQAADYLAVIRPAGEGYRLVPLTLPGSPFTLDGAPLDGPLDLHHGMELRIPGGDPGQTLTLLYLSPAESTDRYQTISFDRPGTLAIGRDEENDIVLPSPNISRFHATLERVGGRFRIRDLNSLNGTFVRGRALETETWLRPGDAFRIG